MTDDEYLDFVFDEFMRFTGALNNYDWVVMFEPDCSMWTIYSLLSKNTSHTYPLSDMFPVMDITSTSNIKGEVDIMLTVSDTEYMTVYEDSSTPEDYKGEETRIVFKELFRIE